MSALANLFRGTVDYAGLFPPAGLPMSTVVENYANYLGSDESAMLGRLIIPAGQLESFAESAAPHLSATRKSSPWRISALVPAFDPAANAFETAIDAIGKFNESRNGDDASSVVVDAIEAKVSSEESIVETIKRLPNQLNTFLEIDWHSDPGPSIQTIANHRSNKQVFAKIRTGGVTPNLIPAPESVARFIVACARHGVGFKATAGLHHTIRASHPLTYEPNAPLATMHGNLNVLVAGIIAFEHHCNEQTVCEILANTDAELFVFDEESLSWDSFSVAADRIAEIRNHFVTSFGSCSFTEPTSELLEIPGIQRESVFAQ